MMFKKVFAAAASALAIAAFAGNAMARDTLRVGTEPTFAPFEFLDTKTQEFSGFDIDLIKAVADKAGYDVKVMNMGFDALIPALSAGTIDVIASGISITEERQKKVDFTSPYYQSGLSYLVRKADAEKIKTFADLKGKTLAVQIGTTGAAYAKNVEGARVSAFNTTSEAFMDLNVKNADAVVLDRPVLAYFLKTKPRVAKNLQLSTEIADAEHFGFAVKKGNAELLQKLNAEGDTVVLITHHMNEAEEADRVIVMDDGRIALDGTPKEVFTQVEPLRTMGLTVPDTVDLLDRLRKDGLDVPLDALTVDECAAAITAALAKN